MRDWVRRMLGIVPPIDTSDPDAVVGACPLQQPHPSNVLINQVIDSTASYLNSAFNIVTDSEVKEVSIPGQTANGAYALDMTQISEDAYAVREAWWSTGSYDVPLLPITFNDLSRDNEMWASATPSTPAYLIVEGTGVYLYPAPSAAGTLKARCQRGILGPMTDNVGFAGIPRELETNVLYTVLVELALVMAGDAEMASRASAFSNRAAAGMDAIARWVANNNLRYQPAIGAVPYR